MTTNCMKVLLTTSIRILNDYNSRKCYMVSIPWKQKTEILISKMVLIPPLTPLS